jgi:C4-dicarboxylate transporter DctM subunit
MSPVSLGFLFCGILILFIFLGMPVSFAMITIGFTGMLFLLPPEAALNFMAFDIVIKFSNYTFSSITLFVLMGTYASITGITTKLFNTAYAWVGQFRGGLSMATIFACGAFAAICGSSAAEVATMGKIAYPEMKKHGYDEALSTGCIASGGCLAPLIPPSTTFILYGLLTETSIGKLFIAGIVPGILMTILMAITVYIMCRRNPSLGPAGPSVSWKNKLISLPGVFDTVGLFVLVIGGLFAGFFTPTQAGGIGAAGALIIGLARKSIKWKGFWSATKEALVISCMIFCLVTGAIVFGHFITLSTIPMWLMNWTQTLSVAPVVVVIIVCLFYIIGGCFLDAMGLIVLTIPIITPVIFALGYDPIWFGVVTVIVAETGVITPPVGVNVYVMKALAPEIPLSTIFRGIIPFFFVICICLVLVIIFPSIATWLPSLGK